jgi:hypothetical protein
MALAIPAIAARAPGAPIRRTRPDRPAMCARSRWFRDGAAVAPPAAMHKSTPSKLALRPQTLRVLTDEGLGRVAGGFIMKDTVIVRTGAVAPAPTVRDR